VLGQPHRDIAPRIAFGSKRVELGRKERDRASLADLGCVACGRLVERLLKRCDLRESDPRSFLVRHVHRLLSDE
jgi:hypothetical protein